MICLDFGWQIDEFMVYCRSSQLRPKTMQSYEQTLRLFERWCLEQLDIRTVDKVTESVIRHYIRDLQERGKYTLLLPQTEVMPRIHAHYGVTKKRTKRGFLYTGVGLSKPESMILLEASAGECIEDSNNTDWDDIIELLGISTLPAQQNAQPS